MILDDTRLSLVFSLCFVVSFLEMKSKTHSNIHETDEEIEEKKMREDIERHWPFSLFSHFCFNCLFYLSSLLSVEWRNNDVLNKTREINQ